MAKKRTILVVEDDPLVTLFISEMLFDAGFAVLQAADARDAMAVLEMTANIDMVLSDIGLPGPVDGISLIWDVRREFPDMPVVLTSGHARPPSSAIPKRVQFLAKPVGAAELVQAVHAALD